VRGRIASLSSGGRPQWVDRARVPSSEWARWKASGQANTEGFEPSPPTVVTDEQAAIKRLPDATHGARQILISIRASATILDRESAR